MNKRKKVGKLSFWWILVLIVAPLLVGFFCICIGRMELSVGTVFSIVKDAVFGTVDKTTQTSTVLNIRIPRILLAGLCGAALSLSGCVFQSLFRNPLATPDTVGVASGASFGAALGILLGGGNVVIQLTSFLAGLLSVGFTYLGGSGRRKGENSLVLSGIMVGSLFSALVSLVKFLADSETELPAITYFLMGSLANANYPSLLVGVIPVIIGMVILVLLRWRLNLLTLSDEEVMTMGVQLKKLRLVTILCATLMTSAAVSMCGQVGWVGLLVPHMCRMIFKNNHLSLVPATISFGAVFMMIVDTLARSLTTQEIPVSVLTAIIGAPFFVFLLKKKGGWTI